MKELDARGRLHITDTTIKYIRYLDESKGVLVPDIWSDISQLRGYGTTNEALDYPTQKPEALLERIINASSNEGDLSRISFRVRAPLSLFGETWS